MIVFALSASVALVLAGWQVVVGQQTTAEAYTQTSVVPHSTDSVSIAIAGDTMFSDGAAKLIASQGVEATLAGVAGMFSGADAAVVNVEAPITALTEPLNPGAQYSYSSPPEAAAALAGIGVTALQLGNNHTMDRGAEGLTDTITHANQAGLSTLGAGSDTSEASKPLLVHAGQLTVALVSFGEDYGSAKRATTTSPGMIVLSDASIRYAERVSRQAGADRVIALVHWGDNYADVDASQTYWSSQLVAAGYDAVIGSGPHVLHPIEVIDGVPVVYSVGNFVFGSPGRFAGYGRVGLGAVATLTFDLTGGTLQMQCVRTDNAVVNYVPRACNDEESAWAASDLQGNLDWQGSIGTLRF